MKWLSEDPLDNDVLSEFTPGTWAPFFVFNDSDVQIAATISFIMASNGPPNVDITYVGIDGLASLMT